MREIVSSTYAGSPQQRWYQRNRKRVLAKQRKERRADVDGKWRARRVLLVAAHTAFVAKIKLKAGCADCGYKKHPVALDFDHRVGEEKRYHVSAMAGRPRKTIEAEIAKCDIVCANCHRIRTHARRVDEDRTIMAKKISLGRRRCA